MFSAGEPTVNGVFPVQEDSEDGLSDGTFSGKKYFSCAPGKALFVLLRMCHKDSRFLESVSSNPRASLGEMRSCQPEKVTSLSTCPFLTSKLSSVA